MWVPAVAFFFHMCVLGFFVWVLAGTSMKKKTCIEHRNRTRSWVLAGTSEPHGKEETNTDTRREAEKTVEILSL
jgi:hypothetical protein